MVCTAHYETPLGPVTLACDGESLTGLWFDGQKYFGSTLGGTDPAAADEPAIPVFAETVRWLDLFFGGKDPGFVPALSFGEADGETSGGHPAGSDGKTAAAEFRVLVWRELLKIPYGQTVTYGELARRIEALPEYAQAGRRVSARAVGGAVGRNPISLIVPCHRVVGAGGKLTGYAGGLERKRKLLELERGAGVP